MPQAQIHQGRATTLPYAVVPSTSSARRAFAISLMIATSVLLLATLVLQIAHTVGWTDRGYANWRPVAFAVALWCIVVDLGIVVIRGSKGWRALFLLPAVQLTLAFVIFPTVFGIYVAFTDWNLSAQGGREFNGIDNFRRMAKDAEFFNALGNNFKYLTGVFVQYVIAFGLAILLNQKIRARRMFRVVFLLPFMLSPVAVGWMIGRSIMDAQYGVLPPLIEKLGYENVSFYDRPATAFLAIMTMDAWYSIPFITVLLVAGLQAIPTEVVEAARIDGASAWQTFRDMTFPLMLPVSLTAILLRMIFEFKLIDIVRVVTGGGPGLATDTLTNYIYREGIQKTNIGYATAMSQIFLLIVTIFVVMVLLTIGRYVRDIV